MRVLGQTERLRSYVWLSLCNYVRVLGDVRVITVMYLVMCRSVRSCTWSCVGDYVSLHGHVLLITFL